MTRRDDDDYYPNDDYYTVPKDKEGLSVFATVVMVGSLCIGVAALSFAVFCWWWQVPPFSAGSHNIKMEWKK